MRYIKIEFTSGLSGFAWQEINDIGVLACYRNADGGIMNLQDDRGETLVYEAKVVEDNVTPPFDTSNLSKPVILDDHVFFTGE
tara:strand:+ start:2196 stop:2444 length:249 start_codon:yes stop_codon:yes gene_type:complete